MEIVILSLQSVPDLRLELFQNRKKGSNTIITNIVNQNFKREFINEDIAAKQIAFTRSPLILYGAEWQSFVFPLIEITDDLVSEDEEVRKNEELRVLQEFQFAIHLGLTTFMYIKLKNYMNPEAVGKYLLSIIPSRFTEKFKFLIEIDLVNKQQYSNMYRSGLNESDDNVQDTWNYWNKLHQATNYNSHFDLALVFSSDLPDRNEIVRWLGEPISMIVIPNSCFITNQNNYPVLPKVTQEVACLFIMLTKCTMAIESHDQNEARIQHYIEYIDFMKRQHIERKRDAVVEFDLNTIPLQPLYDNLDTYTYEVFERDPAKYIYYQRAIELALKDLIPENEVETKKAIVMIVGAGRGIFIRSALNASAITKRKIKIIVVEKNGNAIVTLSCLIQDMWPDKEIELIAEDMRKIKLDEKADIIVSELLGSFGDNELSPECLDGVQHLLKPTGVSIPCNSISYIRPIMTKRNHTQLIKKHSENSKSLRYQNSESTEASWVTLFGAAYYIDEPKELFKFVHPNKDDPIDNTRYKKLEFEAKLDCVLHGFAGYFSSQLYKDIEISILPSNHTPGMFSWYSIYFPINEGIQLRKDDKIEVEYWRKCDAEKVWYEWKVVAPQESVVHNLDGISNPILL